MFSARPRSTPEVNSKGCPLLVFRLLKHQTKLKAATAADKPGFVRCSPALKQFKWEIKQAETRDLTVELRKTHAYFLFPHTQFVIFWKEFRANLDHASGSRCVNRLLSINAFLGLFLLRMLDVTISCAFKYFGQGRMYGLYAAVCRRCTRLVHGGTPAVPSNSK